MGIGGVFLYIFALAEEQVELVRLRSASRPSHFSKFRCVQVMRLVLTRQIQMAQIPTQKAGRWSGVLWKEVQAVNHRSENEAGSGHPREACLASVASSPRGSRNRTRM